MKTLPNSFSAWICGIGLAALVPFANATPLTNGGFEPDLTGWTPTVSSVICDVSPQDTAHGGLWSAGLGCSSPGVATLSQTFDTSVPSSLDFWLRLGVGTPLTDFSADLNGGGFSLDGSVTPVNGFSLYHSLGTLLLTPNVLTFTFKRGMGETTPFSGVFIDDVAQSVPEPGTLMLVGAALACGALVRRKKPA